MTDQAADQVSLPRETFVVRLWYRAAGDKQWVAHVQHVRTGVVMYARGPEELLAYLQGCMEPAELDDSEQSGLR